MSVYEGDLAVFTIDSEEWVVARDAADADDVFRDHAGFSEAENGNVWTRCDPAKTIRWSDEEGEPVMMAYSDLAKRGRGYLGSASW
jgi:hypothetical protein